MTCLIDLSNWSWSFLSFRSPPLGHAVGIHLASCSPNLWNAGSASCFAIYYIPWHSLCSRNMNSNPLTTIPVYFLPPWKRFSHLKQYDAQEFSLNLNLKPSVLFTSTNPRQTKTKSCKSKTELWDDNLMLSIDLAMALYNLYTDIHKLTYIRILIQLDYYLTVTHIWSNVLELSRTFLNAPLQNI